jgi:repressor LexA
MDKKEVVPDHPIAHLRAEHGLTQADLAARIGVAPSTVSRWERGDTEPRVSDLWRVADALDVPVAKVMGQ